MKDTQTPAPKDDTRVLGDINPEPKRSPRTPPRSDGVGSEDELDEEVDGNEDVEGADKSARR
jgi:hypothetical protein